MKVSAFLMLATVGFIYSFGILPGTLPVCPEPDTEGGAVHFPNDDDCSTFYLCNGLTPVLMKCLNGTWFNPEVGVCDWPINVPIGVCVPPVPVALEL